VTEGAFIAGPLLGEKKTNFQVPVGGEEWPSSLIVVEQEGRVSLKAP
jgi:hypothetical protein